MSTLPDKPFTIYFAGELFDSKDLLGNAWLAEAIYNRSQGKYVSLLPQNLEQREFSARAIRDNDLMALFSCDLGLFHFDGTELDSGTVVEFMCAKFADIPSVILRTDMRKAGDAGDIPWNLMASHFPRTLLHVVDLTGRYNKLLRKENLEDPADYLKAGLSSKVSQQVCNDLADEIIGLLNKVRSEDPILEASQTESIYRWIAKMPAFGMGDDEATKKLLGFLKDKKSKKLLQ